MTVAEAKTLIQKGRTKKPESAWADFGCGNGVFTYALAELLSPGSKIYAVDGQKHLLESMRNGTEIEFVQRNFESDSLPLKNLDGILMANSLHYINDKISFIEKMKRWLKADGRLILIEYDTEKPNSWVPYPIPFDKLIQLFQSCGFNRIEKIGERDSVFRSEKMYACLISGLTI